jgi:biopolymer transport protein ExbD
MTPMIDVVFLLIIFFMLVSQFSSAENVEVELPDPEQSQAIEATVPEKVILNIEYVGPEEPPAFLLGSIRVAGLEELSRRLRNQRVETPELQVILRADKRVAYLDVRKAMEVIAANQIEMFHIVARPESAP